MTESLRVLGRLFAQEYHRHAHREAVGDLAQHGALLAVGDTGGHLDAAIDRPGVHSERIGLGAVHSLRRQPEQPRAFLKQGNAGS